MFVLGMNHFRDEPPPRGPGIFPRKSFYSLFLHNKLFFSKVNCNKFFYFFQKNNTLKSAKVHESNIFNEKN